MRNDNIVAAKLGFLCFYDGSAEGRSYRRTLPHRQIESGVKAIFLRNRIYTIAEF